MNEWNCPYCDWVLEIPTGMSFATPERCPLCLNEDQENNRVASKHRMIAAEDLLGAFGRGESVSGVYVEELRLDGQAFEHEVSLTQSIVGAWRSRDTTFTSGLDISETIFLSRLETGTGRSEVSGRHIHGARFEGPLKMRETVLRQGGRFDGCNFARSIHAVGMVSQGQLHFSGVNVAGTVNLSRSTLDFTLFINAIINGALMMDNVIFMRDFNATALSVSGPLQAGNAVFNGEFYIGESTFADEVNFFQATFNDSVSIDATEFADGFEFDSVQAQKNLEFREVEFNSYADFEWAQFAGPVAFESAHFHAFTSFEDSYFHGPVTFRISHFHDDAHFRRIRFQDSLAFIVVNFQQRVDLRDIDVVGEFKFERSRFLDHVYLSKSQFETTVNWDENTFEGQVKNHNVSIKGPASWSNCEFNGELSLVSSSFKEDLLLSHCQVNGVLDLRNANFKGTVDLSKSEIQGQIRLSGIDAQDFIVELEQVKDNLESEITKDWPTATVEWEFLRESFEHRNQMLAVDHVYFKKRQAQNRAERKAGKWILSIVEHIFIEWGTGYGVRPYRVFLMSFATIVMFAAVDMVFFATTLGLEETSSRGLGYFVESLQFSFSTFSALGSGELIVAIEAFIGGFLMAIFTAILTRRIFRE